MPHEILPPSLRWPAEKAERRALALQLPLRLFGELRQALARIEPPDSSDHSAETSARFLAAWRERNEALPSPADVAAAWDERPKTLLEQSKDVSDETMSRWIEAYALAWGWEEEPDEPHANHPNPYVMGCADLLTDCYRRISIPIATIDGHQVGRVQMLHLDVTNLLLEGFFVHPEFEFARQYLDSDFLGSIETAWRLAGSEAAKKSLVFWSITEADGSPIIDRQKSGPSASAAAFRAFWHVRREVPRRFRDDPHVQLSLDDDVYVIASCAAGTGSIEDVGGLSAKISAIQQHREKTRQKVPATIVLAQNATSRSALDVAAIAHASTWAEVKSVATTEDLIAVRSCMTNATIAYLHHLADKLDESPWFRNGQPMHLSDVHIPAYVWKEERRSDGEDRGSRGEKDWRPSGYDPAAADREAGPRLERATRQVRVPWESELHPAYRTDTLVLVGGPGFGKTTTLHWTARQMALQAIAELKARQGSCDNVPWPVLADLDSWAGTNGQPRESLFAVSFSKIPVPEHLPKLQREALPLLMERRLNASSANTFLFLDALDQVTESRARRLRERLTALADFAPRLVLSTRESGLRTHSHTMPFPNLTLLQAAALSAEDASALAAKWLGEAQASRLEAHLRTHSSLGIVADSPLLLTLACIVQTTQPGQPLPETPAALYGEMMRSLAKGEWRASAPSLTPAENPDALLDSLQPIAWRLFVKNPGINRFDRSTLLDAITTATGRLPEKAGELLTTLVDLAFLESSGREAGEEHFHFRHTTFLEFLAAKYVASRLNRDGWGVAEVDAWQSASGWQKAKVGHLLDAQAFEPAWEPIIIFTAGLMREPLPLLENLADRKRDDLFRHRFDTLFNCLETIPMRQRSCLRAVVPKMLHELRALGLKTVMGRPDQQKQWIRKLRIATNFFSAERELCEVASAVAHYHAKTHMGGAEHMLEAFEKPSNLVGARNSVAVLQSLFFDDEVHMFRGHYAIDHMVRIADAFGLPEPIDALVTKRDQEGAPVWRTIIIARALLSCQNLCEANASVDILIRIMDDAAIEDSCWRREAAEALIAGVKHYPEYPFDCTANEMPSAKVERSALENRIEAVLASLLLREHKDKVSKEVQQSLAISVFKFMRPQLTDTRSAIVELAIRRKVGVDHTKSHVWWAAELMDSGISGVRNIAGNFLLGLAEFDSEEGNSALYSLTRRAAKSQDTDERDVVANLLRERLAMQAAEGHVKMETIDLMRELGLSYPNEIRPRLLEVVHHVNADLSHLDEVGLVAKKHGDRDLMTAVLKRLLDTAGTPSISPKLLVGTEYWQMAEASALEEIKKPAGEGSGAAWFGINGIAFGSKASCILTLVSQLLVNGRRNWRPWHKLLRELDKRGWRLRLRGRRIEVLRKGQDEPRADADFSY